MEERRAIARLKRGDIGGLEPLVRRYQLSALRAAILITRDRAMAEDLVQEAFLRAFERIDQFDASRPFGPWFLRMVVNDAIKMVMRRGSAPSLDAPDAVGATLAERIVAPASDPLALLERAETVGEVAAALARLPAAQRAAIVQRYYLDMGEEAMAVASAVPAGTVKSRLHAARQRLRHLLGHGVVAGPEERE
jgi:RNA polymerase sigma-70 factor (ECF subfamily)